MKNAADPASGGDGGRDGKVQVGRVLVVKSAGLVDQVPGQRKEKLGIASGFWPERLGELIGIS